MNWSTDWLNSDPVFYNEKNLKVSNNINDVIEWKDLEFHPEGLNNYLDFGYSVFGQTPIKNVKFLKPNQKLTLHENSIIIEDLHDPAEDFVNKTTSVKEVKKLLNDYIHKWEEESSGELIIPTSGGYDSRLLNLFIENKERVKAYTFGISTNQAESHEVVKAQRVCDELGIQWEQVQLGNFHNYLDDWLEMYGSSTHAHGMYQMEFYSKVREKNRNSVNILSGIVGDAWAGSIKSIEMDKPKDLIKLGYSHGMQIDSKYCVLDTNFKLREKFWNNNVEKLKSQYWQNIYTIRFKMILLSYLLKVPQKFGFNVSSPFLEPDIALSMCTLPSEMRENRKWQKNIFKEAGIYFENSEWGLSKSNSLNLQGLIQVPLDKLDPALLSEIIEVEYVNWINQTLNSVDKKLFSLINKCFQAFSIPLVGKIFRLRRILRVLGIDNDEVMDAYNAYLVLKPLEQAIINRKRAQ